jgi:hypothetical protein
MAWKEYSCGVSPRRYEFFSTLDSAFFRDQQVGCRGVVAVGCGSGDGVEMQIIMLSLSWYKVERIAPVFSRVRPLPAWLHGTSSIQLLFECRHH